MNIEISENIKNCLDKGQLGVLIFQAEVRESDEAFWSEMYFLLQHVQHQYQLDSVNKNTSISSAREAYKLCGKDPNRYRPSADSLIRRVVKDRGLYRVNNVVDTLNYISIKSGISIGGYDIDKIDGKTRFDVGQDSDTYVGIGRGDLNIAGMPVLRDETGVFGSPTSDSERTKITLTSEKIAFVFFDFGYYPGFQNDILLTEELLKKFAYASEFRLSLFKIAWESD